MPWVVRLCFLLLESVATNWLVLASSSGITPKAGADGPENAENPGSAAVPENANAVDDALRSPPPQPAPEKNVLFEAVTSLEEQLTALHAALPPRTAFLRFSGHSTHAGCLRSPRAAQSFRRARIRVRGRTVALLLLLMRERRQVVVAVSARCGGTRRMIARSRRRLCVRGWVCYSLASRCSVIVTS